MATDNPLSAFFRGLQGAAQQARQIQQQEEENALTQQLRQIQLLNAQRQAAEALKTPEQKLSEQIQEAFAIDALKRGALVQAPVGLQGESIALPSAINQTAAQLEAANAFPAAVQATPLSISSGIQSAPSLSDAIAEIITPQATPSFSIPSAPNKGFEVPTAIPGFNVSEEAARQKSAADVAKAVQLAKAKFEATPAGYQIFTDALGNVSYIPKTPGRGEVQAITNPETGEQLKGRVPATGQRSVLAEDKNGRITNIVLGSGESLPEGYKEHIKPSSATADPQKLRKEFNALQVVKDFRAITPQFQRMQQAIEESKTTKNFTAVDQTLINTFNRVLDPQSVVRESEYARTAADQSVLDYLKGKFDPDTGKLSVGGAGLTPETRAAMIRMAERFVNASRANFDQTANFYENAALKSNIDPALVIQGIEEVRQRTEENLPRGTISTPTSPAPIGSTKIGRFTVTPR